MNLLERSKLEGRIMIVDDEPSNVLLLRRMLGHAGCTDVFSTCDSREALALAASSKPDAILLDINMPHIDGIKLLGLFTERYPNRISLPILVLTADNTTETKHRALKAGASDFLTKPLDAVEVTLRLANHLRTRSLHLTSIEGLALLESRVRERTQDLEEAQAEIIDRLSVATESRDDQTGQHLERMAAMTADIAEEMGLGVGNASILRRAARLHDIGKIAVPDSILLKPGALTEQEFAVMREHAAAGARVLRGSRFPLLIRAEEIAHYHHERWDGTGYPAGLKGRAIPLSARIAAVADVFDALTHDRPYKLAWPLAAAVAEIHRSSGTQFDPDVVDAFQKVNKSGRRRASEHEERGTLGGSYMDFGHSAVINGVAI